MPARSVARYALRVQPAELNSPATDRPLPALVVDGVGKRFSLPVDRVQTLKERALHPIRSSERKHFEALHDLSFQIEKGEFFGLVGRNGSGKSTLLKCIAGIYRTDEGSIYYDGTVTSFIELGVGFNPELAALDNVVLNATLLGLSPDEARSRYERVMDFAELWEFQNLKLKNYSSGMHVRLAFSVMLQIDADILLIDEVLAVGDASFQQKCFDEFNHMRDQHKTIIFVTHSMDSIKRFCDRAALLDRGRMIAIGEPAEISDRYLALNFEADSVVAEAPTTEIEYSGARIADAWVEDEAGERRGGIKQGTAFSVHVLVEFEKPAIDPWLALSIENELHHVLMVTASINQTSKSGSFAAGERAHFAMSCDCVFAPGRCDVTIESGPADSPRRFFRGVKAASFVVTGENAFGADVVIPHDFTVTPVGRSEVGGRAIGS